MCAAVRSASGTAVFKKRLILDKDHIVREAAIFIQAPLSFFVDARNAKMHILNPDRPSLYVKRAEQFPGSFLIEKDLILHHGVRQIVRTR